MKTRIETDMLGSREVPEEALWGIHTARAASNFKLGSRRTPRSLIAAYARVKQACCRANRELGHLDRVVADAIEWACVEVAQGGYADQFPLDALQGGAGTSTNMNVNEVVANLALQRLGRARGDYEAVGPLAHVNLHQSTNDTYPTALRLAAIGGMREVSEALAALQGALQKREAAFAHIVTIGRTELVDAVPVTLGREFGAFAEAFARDRWRTFKCEERLRTVNLGGTAVGTGLAAPRAYIFLVVEKLRELTGIGFCRADNLMDATANADAFVEVSATLKAAASNLVKVSGDLRLLHMSGEIRLPAVQAGSSIMPGKVNPVILESVMQAGLRVIAADGVVADCASRGSLQINEFLPLLAAELLDGLELLRNAAAMLARHVEGVTADEARCAAALAASPMLITAFVPALGYERCAELMKGFDAGAGGNVRQYLASKLGCACVDETLHPDRVNALGFR